MAAKAVSGYRESLAAVQSADTKIARYKSTHLFDSRRSNKPSVDDHRVQRSKCRQLLVRVNDGLPGTCREHLVVTEEIKELQVGPLTTNQRETGTQPVARIASRLKATNRQHQIAVSAAKQRGLQARGKLRLGGGSVDGPVADTGHPIDLGLAEFP
jgi:hypothetical protein